MSTYVDESGSPHAMRIREPQAAPPHAESAVIDVGAEVVDIRDIFNRSIAIRDKALSLQIVDQASYELVASNLRDAVTARKAIVAYHVPLKQRSWAAHQGNLADEKAMLAPALEAEELDSAHIAAYENAQKRIQAENAEKARIEAERIAALDRQRAIDEAARLKSLEMARMFDEAASPEEAQVILAETDTVVAAAIEEARAEPMPAVTYRVEPVIQRVRGVATKTVYDVEVTSMRQLCKAIAEGTASIEYILPNLPALKKIANVLKESFDVPGVRLLEDTKVNARGR